MRNGNKPGHHEPPETTPAAPVGERTLVSEQTAMPEQGSPVQIADGAPVATAPEPASVHVIVLADRTRIVVSGEIDADLAAELQEAAGDAEATGLPIEVDAQHVTFMDSSGIAFLARVAARSAERVRVLHAPDTVRFLLEITRIGELLDLVDDEESPVGEPADALPRIGMPTSPTPDDAA